MSQRIDLPSIIPVFPLPGALLLPRSQLPLHIFEPRYLAMIEDVMKTQHRMMGMIQPTVFQGEERLQTIGCAGRLTQFSETEDGRYMITLTGISRYRIREEETGFQPYRRFNVDWSGFEADQAASALDSEFDREGFYSLLAKYFEARGLTTDWEAMKDADDELLINSLSMMLDFEKEDKQALLEAPSLMTRRETLVTLIEYSLRGGDAKEILQ